MGVSFDALEIWYCWKSEFAFGVEVDEETDFQKSCQSISPKVVMCWNSHEYT